MKRTIFLVLVSTLAGAAVAQDEDQKIRNQPNFQGNRPLGSPGWPEPRDRKDEYALGNTPERHQSVAGLTEQEEYNERAREWRRLQYEQQHPLSVNLSGDPDATSYNPMQQSRSRQSYGGSSYATVPRPRYTPPSSYGEAVRRDNSWLRPNFGSPPPRPQPTYRLSPPASRGSGSSRGCTWTTIKCQ